MKKKMFLPLIALVLVGCGSSSTSGTVTVCNDAADYDDVSVQYTYTIKGEGGYVTGETRQVDVQYLDLEVAEEDMSYASFGEEKGNGYVSNITKLSDTSISNVLEIDYNELDEESAYYVGVDAVEGSYLKNNFDDLIVLIESLTDTMTCKVQ